MDNIMTFFSDTDTKTLNIEGNDRNHFVSLIVNNAGKYTAAITRKIEYIATKKCYKSFEDKEVVNSDFKEVVSSKVEYFDLKVKIEGLTSDDMEERLATIKERKAKIPITTSYIPSSGANYYGTRDSDYGKNYYGNDMSEDPDDTYYSNAAPYYPKKEETTIKKEQNLKDTRAYSNQDSKKDSSIMEDTSLLGEKELSTALKQIVTGSIVLSNDSKLDINKWVESSMEAIFDKRFGDTKSGFEAFNRWATDYVDFILWDLIDTYAGDISIEEDQMISDCSFSLISLLDQLPKSKTNKYIIALIDIINGYC